MSNWKVSRETIEVFPHPGAERLEVGKAGTYQVVVQKGLYKNGDEVVFAPEKSVLTGRLLEEYGTMLAGPDKNRVKAVRLRNELSCGIIIPNELVEAITGKQVSELPKGEDISAIFGITKYEPPIPAELLGKAEPIPYDKYGTRHDCEQFGVYGSNFTAGERIIATEKIHGTQGVYYIALRNNGNHIKWASMKGLHAKGICIMEEEGNLYWRASNNAGLWEAIKKNYNTAMGEEREETCIQVFAEVFPCPGGYNYGKTEATLLLFDLRVDGESIPYDKVPEDFKKMWVPVIYDGPLTDVQELKSLAKGKETISGKTLHIREGIVVRPYIDRRASDGTKLRTKIINPDYKETGEELN